MRTARQHAFEYWKRRQTIVAHKQRVQKFTNMKQLEKTVRRVKYHGWNIMFRLAMAEFYLNLWAGKFLIALFNLTNKHKVRVNRNVGKYAELCNQTTK